MSASALRKLIKSSLSAEDLEAAFEAIADERNEKVAAIMAASLFETILGISLTAKLPGINDLAFYERLFDSGPFSTFEYKILMARACEIIGPVTESNLHAIRHVRSAFAHTLKKLSFDTKEIRDMCASIKPTEYIKTRTGSVIKDFINDSSSIATSLCLQCSALTIERLGGRRTMQPLPQKSTVRHPLQFHTPSFLSEKNSVIPSQSSLASRWFVPIHDFPPLYGPRATAQE